MKYSGGFSNIFIGLFLAAATVLAMNVVAPAAEERPAEEERGEGDAVSKETPNEAPARLSVRDSTQTGAARAGGPACAALKFGLMSFFTPGECNAVLGNDGEDEDEKDKDESVSEPVSYTPPPASVVHVEEPEPVPEPDSESPAPSEAEEEPQVEEDPDGPDIALRALSYYGAKLEEGETPSISVIAKNDSGDNLGTFWAQLFVDRSADGTRDVVLAKRKVGPFFPEGEAAVIWKNAWSLEEGTHRFEVCADVTDIFIESNEHNNCDSLLVTVDTKMDNADITVRNARSIPQRPAVGEMVGFYATIANQGEEQAGSERVSLEVDGRRVANTPLSRLDPGETEEMEWSTIWRAEEAGAHTFEVCADARNSIFETNEENNCASARFSVE